MSNHGWVKLIEPFYLLLVPLIALACGCRSSRNCLDGESYALYQQADSLLQVTIVQSGEAITHGDSVVWDVTLRNVSKHVIGVHLESELWIGRDELYLLVGSIRLGERIKLPITLLQNDDVASVRFVLDSATVDRLRESGFWASTDSAVNAKHPAVVCEIYYIYEETLKQVGLIDRSNENDVVWLANTGALVGNLKADKFYAGLGVSVY